MRSGCKVLLLLLVACDRGLRLWRGRRGALPSEPTPEARSCSRRRASDRPLFVAARQKATAGFGLLLLLLLVDEETAAGDCGCGRSDGDSTSEESL